MRRRTDETAITTALHDLDAGVSADLTAAERKHAEATFNRIVATPTDERVHAAPRRPPGRRGRLLAPLALAGAAGVALPVLLLGGGAYGTWTPTPVSLDPEAAAKAADTCLARLSATASAPRVAVAERRGGWTYVLLAGPRTEAVCLLPAELIGRNRTAGGAIFGSYDADVPVPPTLARDRIIETTSQEGNTAEGWFNRVEGYVGGDVAGVTVHTSSGLEVQASVVGNRFAAWWPSAKQDSDHSAETWSYTVHLADGSTRHAVCSRSTQQC